MNEKPTLIRNWEELFALPPSRKGYKIKSESEHRCNAWIVPVVETEETEKNYWEHHMYLSTHTFYGKNKDGTGIDSYKESTKILQKFGFNIEIDNWDKEE